MIVPKLKEIARINNHNNRERKNIANHTGLFRVANKICYNVALFNNNNSATTISWLDHISRDIIII